MLTNTGYTVYTKHGSVIVPSCLKFVFCMLPLFDLFETRYNH